MAHPDYPAYPVSYDRAAGIAVVEAVAVHGENATLFIVYFRGSSKAFWSETVAVNFAIDISESGWDENWTEEGHAP